MTRPGRTETHAKKRDRVPLLGVMFERYPADGNVDHAADNTQKQESKKILGRNANFSKSPGKQTELDQSEGHQKQKYEYKHEKDQKRREEHVNILLEYPLISEQ